MADRFPSPFEIAAPTGAEGWQELYALLARCSARTAVSYEESVFWFQDGVHWPEALTPWDATVLEFAIASLAQYNTRHYVIPPAHGHRLSASSTATCTCRPVGAAPEAEIEARVPQFMERAGYYFAQLGPAATTNWLRQDPGPHRRAGGARVRAAARHARTSTVVTVRAGHGSGDELLARLPPAARARASRCGSTTSSSSTSATPPTSTSSGSASRRSRASPTWRSPRWSPAIEVDLFRPDDELKQLARLAVELRRRRPLQPATSAGRLAALRRPTRPGRQWIAAWERPPSPWFNFSTGSGFYHSDKVWLENLEIPLGFIARLHRQGAGGRGHRPPDRGVCTPSATGSSSEYRDAARPDEDRARLRRQARPGPARCSRTSRTTTSTSSTGRTR